MSAIDKIITQIAVEHIIGITTLRTRSRDSLDFHEVSVWELRAALIAAYTAGKEARKI